MAHRGPNSVLLAITFATQLTACAGNATPDELNAGGSSTTQTSSTGQSGGQAQVFAIDANFKSSLIGQDWNNSDTAMRFIADFDGDGMADLMALDPNSLYFSKNISAMFSKPAILRDDYSQANGWTSENQTPRIFGDVNGDGKEDIVGCGFTNLVVNISDGSSTAGSTSYHEITTFTIADGYQSQDLSPRFLADVNGDGKADLIGINPNGVRVGISSGTSFATPTVWSKGTWEAAEGWTSQTATPRMMADVNGDGKADMVGFSASGIWVALSTGTSFSAVHNVSTEFGGSNWPSNNSKPRFAADINGDAQADFIAIDDDGVHVALGQGIEPAQSSYIAFVGFQPSAGWSDQIETPRFVADVNGDKKADLLGFSASGLTVVLAP